MARRVNRRGICRARYCCERIKAHQEFCDHHWDALGPEMQVWVADAFKTPDWAETLRFAVRFLKTQEQAEQDEAEDECE